MSERSQSNRQPLIAELRRRATNIREHAPRMGAVQGQGYVGQALGI
ncbi:MAG: transketolase, partial [Devosia sp.]